MSGMDRLTDGELANAAALLRDDLYMQQCDGLSALLKTAKQAASAIDELLSKRKLRYMGKIHGVDTFVATDAAHRRASQAAPGGCGYPCGYDCNGACFQAAPAPSDELAQIDAMLMEGQGDDDGDQVLPDFEPGWSVAAKVEACLHLLEKRRDLIAAPAPSDGLREAAATILAVLQDPDSLPIEKHPDWQAIYNAMTADHNESVEISGDSWHDWPSILIAGLEVMAQDSAALTPAPAQEGGE